MQKLATPTLQMVDHYRNNKPLTLADIDADQDFSELEYLVETLAGPYCKSIEFHDDNRKHGCRCLEFNVRTAVYNGAIDRDEDGKYPDTGDVKQRIWVPVHDEMTIEQIAYSVMNEVRSIENNVFS
ncbi:hypothetical protein [Spirosoma aerolatum]|uniref:hypothetical protein n=1 Tax=Spirosoma aerolatum TaxID=1211326 RepID=UPI0009ADF07E|nr:hypothetical protein [Spirosoma aerolatum]